MTDAPRLNPPILIIEDETTQRRLLLNQLQSQGYQAVAASSGREGLDLWAERPDIRMVITDLSMPDMDGVAVVEAIRAREKRYTYLMVLTILDDKECLLRALGAGADDFVGKPVLREELDLRLQSANRLLRLEDQDKLVVGLAELAANRAGEENAHIQRVKRYCFLLADNLRLTQPHLGLSSQTVEDIANASVLHDIGLMNVPDSLLNRRGRLSAKEMLLIQEHAAQGGKILEHLYRETGSFYLLLAHEMAAHHHERWDGGGYPQGLRGDAIPLAGRIMALADSYNALRSRRPYKDPMPAEHTEAVIVADSGKQFDPMLVDSFQRLKGQFAEIHDQLRDRADLW
jgi:putative two-component system response regulator